MTPGEELNKLGMGSLTFWGATPACDLTEIMSKEQQELSSPSHILLLGQNDARHILKTMANLKNMDREFNFYIAEGHPILLARQLLLIHLALLPLDQLGLHEKTTEFMEVFGNVLIRPQTKKTIRKACETLIKLITNEGELAAKMPLINLEDLKFRDRDAIVECLHCWAESQMLCTDMQELWNIRLRQHLGTRYDARAGVFDWDYQMRVVEKNKETQIIHASEYKTWRNGGQAFNEYESDYNQANPTYFYAKSQTFHGDLLVGPFISYGIQSDDQSYFELTNGQHKKKSSDVTFHNLEKIFSIISPKTEAEGLENFRNIKIHFLPMNACENLCKKSKYIEKFDTVHVTCFMGHQLKSAMVKMLKLNAVIVVDRPRYIWYFRAENEKAFEKKLLALVDAAGLVLDGNDVENATTTVFQKFKIGKITSKVDEEKVPDAHHERHEMENGKLTVKMGDETKGQQETENDLNEM